MIRIFLKCSDETAKLLKQLLLNKLDDCKFIDQDDLDETCIIIREIIDNINDVKKYPGLVFVVSDGRYMFDLLEYQPLGFIRKNCLESDIAGIVNKINYFNQGLETSINFKSSYSTIRLQIENIVYIESYAHYLIVHSKSSSVKVREKLSAALNRLSSYGFVQVHKSYIINSHYLVSKNIKEVILKDRIVIPVGKKYQQIVKQI